ncbi:MAG: peptidoglycan-associated lipoprotein Pal [Desulfopila sp.]
MQSDAAGTEESLDTAASGGISEGRTSAPMLPVYFDFDASGIRGDQQSRIQVNADFLNQKPDVTIRIEGNCDQRGTNEYNMALGERRALAAKKYLVHLGIAESRMSTVSYGEERALLQGQDELSWAQNRRDDFVIE